MAGRNPDVLNPRNGACLGHLYLFHNRRLLGDETECSATDFENFEDMRTFLCETEAPSQEDIYEGICINDQQIEVSRGFRGAVREYGCVAVYNRKVVAQSTTHEGLFRKLRTLGPSLCFPRVFQVNDHGNVTEFSYAGKVLGEWV